MYFEKPGPGNSEQAIEIAVRQGKERNISHIVISSNSGKTAELLADEAKRAGYTGQLVCVTHAYGFRENGKNELADEDRRRLEERGVKVYTSSHILSGAERALSRTYKGTYPVEIIAQSLKMLGQGTKVCVEISVMALDGGVIPFGTPVIALGGTGGGVDTAVILSPAHGSNIFNTRIHEILCKPWLGSSEGA